MSDDEIEVRFLGGPLHGTSLRLPSSCESYVHNRGETNAVTYYLSRRRSIPGAELSPVFTTEDAARGLQKPDPLVSSRSC